MPKYHISPATGRPNICTANKRACPVWGQHYASKEDAVREEEERLAEEHGIASPGLKRRQDHIKREDELFGRLTDRDKDYAQKWAEVYKDKGASVVSEVRRNTVFTIAALRQLESEAPGSVQILNGGACYRYSANTSQWTIEVQNGSDGTTHARIFNAGVPVYGDHSRDSAWTFPARKSVTEQTETIGKLYKDFISAEKNKAPEPMWG